MKETLTGIIIVIIIIFGLFFGVIKLYDMLHQPDIRTVKEILDDNYKDCIKNSFYQDVSKCKNIYN